MYGQATEAVWTLYQKRYDKELGWTNDKFRDVVTKGCFPLHPLTTALLCHLKMQQGLDDDARTILKFVIEQVEFKLNEPAIGWQDQLDLPINLADYFGKRIASDQIYAAYEKQSIIWSRLLEIKLPRLNMMFLRRYCSDC